MLHVISDAKNAVYGALLGGMRGATRWGSWAFGFNGETFDREDNWKHFNFGGLMLPGMLLEIAMFTTMPGAGLILWLGGTVASAAIGGVLGAVTGGFRTMQQGVEIRKEKETIRQSQQQARRMEKARSQPHHAPARAEDVEGLVSGKSFVDALENEPESVRGRG